jgi:hypothetical protein
MAATSPRLATGARRFAGALALLLAFAAAFVAAVAGAGDATTPAGGAKAACVEETAFMRRNHMDLLRQHRDRSTREGIRTTRHSLEGCVNCHADKATNSVIGRNAAGEEGFCAGCHRYVAVSVDCFECHAAQRAPGVAARGEPGR